GVPGPARARIAGAAAARRWRRPRRAKPHGCERGALRLARLPRQRSLEADRVEGVDPPRHPAGAGSRVARGRGAHARLCAVARARARATHQPPRDMGVVRRCDPGRVHAAPAARHDRSRQRALAPDRVPAGPRAGAGCRWDLPRMSPRLDRGQFTQLACAVVAVLATHVGHLPAWFATVLGVTVAARAGSRARSGATVPAWIRLPLAALLLVWVYQSFGSVFGREP